MSLPLLNVSRHDRKKRALITPAGGIDPETVPLVRAVKWLHEARDRWSG